MAIRTIVFDVGETLFDETRLWSRWADWIGVSRLTFLATLGAVIERGQHHREVFRLLAPDMDLNEAREQRRRTGDPDLLEPGDLYADALPCLQSLANRDIRIAVAGNQLATIEPMLNSLPVPLAFVGSSGRWGVEKPAIGFFERIVEAAGEPPAQLAYVGDHLDNDVLPARAIGMAAVLLRRGPWGTIHAGRAEASQASAVIDTLTDLPGCLERL